MGGPIGLVVVAGQECGYCWIWQYRATGSAWLFGHRCLTRHMYQSHSRCRMQLARKLSGFDCELLSYDPLELMPGRDLELGVRACESLEELLAASDIVSLVRMSLFEPATASSPSPTLSFHITLLRVG